MLSRRRAGDISGGCAGIGRQARLRGVCQQTYGFKSHQPHQILWSVCRIDRAEKAPDLSGAFFFAIYVFHSVREEPDFFAFLESGVENTDIDKIMRALTTLNN